MRNDCRQSLTEVLADHGAVLGKEHQAQQSIPGMDTYPAVSKLYYGERIAEQKEAEEKQRETSDHRCAYEYQVPNEFLRMYLHWSSMRLTFKPEVSFDSSQVGIRVRHAEVTRP